jgi:hypothetical protein
MARNAEPHEWLKSGESRRIGGLIQRHTRPAWVCRHDRAGYRTVLAIRHNLILQRIGEYAN